MCPSSTEGSFSTIYVLLRRGRPAAAPQVDRAGTADLTRAYPRPAPDGTSVSGRSPARRGSSHPRARSGRVARAVLVAPVAVEIGQALGLRAIALTVPQAPARSRADADRG